MTKGQKGIGIMLLIALAAYFLMLGIGCVANGAPADELGPAIPYGDKDSLQIKIRIQDLSAVKDAVPFAMGKYRVWRAVELEKFGENTPQEWWTTVRLDRVFVAKDREHEPEEPHADD